MDSAAMDQAAGGVVCPLCGAGEAEPLGLSANGALVGCPGCSLTYCRAAPAAPEGTAVAPYYGAAPDYEDYRRRKEAEWRELFGRLRRYVPGGRLLDVGCARGYSTAVARELGFAAYGVELSAADAAYAREQLGLPVQACAVAEADFPAGFFDAVVMWVVLEHLRDPRGAMAAVARMLRPGGVVNICTVNGASRAAREQGVSWVEYNRPGHVVFFSPATLRRLLVEQGLRPVEMYTTLWGAAAGQRRRGWLMAPALAPLRRAAKPVIARLLGRAAWEGEYLAGYAVKSLDER